MINTSDNDENGSNLLLFPMDAELDELPEWIKTYVQWHNDMRNKFPGTQLLSDPKAPKLLVSFCCGSAANKEEWSNTHHHGGGSKNHYNDNEVCGGLNDRLGRLPFHVAMANQTQRLLLYHWCAGHPAPLPEFLIPHRVDWTFPTTTTTIMHQQVNMTEIPDFFANQGAVFRHAKVDQAIERANHGVFQDERILRSKVFGKEQHFEQRLLLQMAGGSSDEPIDTIEWTLSYGRLFWLFFRPSPAVRAQVEQTLREQQLRPGQYSAVHCRVRHPNSLVLKKFDKRSKQQDAGIRDPDMGCLLWEGTARQGAIDMGKHAVQCAMTHGMNNATSSNNNRNKSQPEPIYFYSDSEDLVRHMTTTTGNASSSSGENNATTLAQQRDPLVVSRTIQGETLHLEQ